MNALNAIYTFLTGQMSDVAPICNSETLDKAYAVCKATQQKFGTVLSPKELIKKSLDSHLLIAKCTRIMKGLPAFLPPKERIPFLGESSIKGYKMVARENVFTIAEEVTWENSLPGMVVNGATRAFAYVNTPTGFAVAVTVVAAGVISIYAYNRAND